MLGGLDPQPSAGSAGNDAAAASGSGGAPSGSSGGTAALGGTAGSQALAGSGGTAAGTGGGAEGGTGGGGGGAGGSSSGGSAGATGGGGSASDACPDDPDKTEPGKCGCGIPDEDSAQGASCVPLQQSLVHRYSFEGNAKDSVGSADGVLEGGASISGGALVLAGGSSGQYLDLPNGLISSLNDATLEVFVTWTGSAGGDWQRVFDFGSSDQAEDSAGDGNKYLFLSARTFRACYTSATPKSEIYTDSSAPFPADSATQVAVVVSSQQHTLSLYLEGEQVGSTALTLPLSAINDVNDWLGRSQYAADAYFAGKISEFRIYSAALSGPQLMTSKKMGESSTYLTPR